MFFEPCEARLRTLEWYFYALFPEMALHEIEDASARVFCCFRVVAIPHMCGSGVYVPFNRSTALFEDLERRQAVGRRSLFVGITHQDEKWAIDVLSQQLGTGSRRLAVPV